MVRQTRWHSKYCKVSLLNIAEIASVEWHKDISRESAQGIILLINAKLVLFSFILLISKLKTPNICRNTIFLRIIQSNMNEIQTHARGQSRYTHRVQAPRLIKMKEILIKTAVNGVIEHQMALTTKKQLPSQGLIIKIKNNYEEKKRKRCPWSEAMNKNSQTNCKCSNKRTPGITR